MSSSDSFSQKSQSSDEKIQGKRKNKTKSTTNKNAKTHGIPDVTDITDELPLLNHERINRTCAPGRRKYLKEKLPERADICLTDQDIQLIIHMYNNSKDRRDTEKISFEKGNPRQETDALMKLHDRLGTSGIGHEHEWLELPFLMDSRVQAHLKKTAFKPELPQSWKMNPYEWLSNLEIEAVMSQYELTHPDFAFIGVFPMDFSTILDDGKCVSVEMCNIDLQRLWLMGKTHLGMIFNTDKHYESGSHWVACYVDMMPDSPNYGMSYYDSALNPVPSEISKLHKSLVKQRSDQFPFRTNSVQKQFKNTECGIFSMFFLVCCISRRFAFKDICNYMGRDEEIHELRKVFFRDNDDSI